MHPAPPIIYLASQSPRRKSLLQQIGIPHEVLLLRTLPPRGPDISEAIIVGETPEIYVKRVTQEKAAFAWKVLHMRKLPLLPVLAADTTVALEQTILGKPGNVDEARAMMRMLSGKTHRVLTAVTLLHDDKSWHAIQRSDVTFAHLGESDIEAYCGTDEPYDKAGGYGIQGRAATFISHISGSYSGIMGLPLHETSQLLSHIGIKAP